jgi:hypothetical protein
MLAALKPRPRILPSISPLELALPMLSILEIGSCIFSSILPYGNTFPMKFTFLPFSTILAIVLPSEGS